VKKLEAFNHEIKLSDGKERFCEPCTISKQHAIPSHTPQERAKARLDLIHIDIAGGGATLPSTVATAMEDGEFDYKNADTPSLRGARYFMIIIDDYSRYRWFFILVNKSDALQTLIDWITKMKTQHGITPKRIRTDEGGEWVNHAAEQYTKDMGMQWEPTAPYAQSQDGIAERSIRTIVSRARTLMQAAPGLPREL
jgi:histone deacetylase 1/2